MEHFLLIGCINGQCAKITASLRRLYPFCKVEIATPTTSWPPKTLNSIVLAIIFSNAPIPTAIKHLPVLVIANTDETGLQAITEGASDYVLTDAGEIVFENAVSKAMARTNAGYPMGPKTAEAPYASLLSAINEIVWSKNADDHRLQYVNSACEMHLGYAPDELLTDNTLFTSRVHPDDKPVYAAAFKKMIVSGKLEEYEFRFRHRDGSWRNMRSRGGLVKGNAGDKKMLAGITIDVTNLVTSETIVKEKTRALEDILESIGDCVYSLDKEWNFTYINAATEQLFNVKRSDLLGKNIWDVFPLGRGTDMYLKYHQAFAQQKTVSLEAFSPNIQKWLFTSAYPSPKGLTIFLKDISQRKELEEKIYTDRQNLFSIMNATADVIWSVDKELNILIANQAFWDTVTKKYGKNREAMGNKITEEFYGKDLQYWKEVYARGFLGSSFKMVETTETAAGITFSEITMNPIRDLEYNVVGLSCFSRDITQTKEHLTKIELQNQNMREIAWIQSHKVRGPVSTILGLAQIFNIEEPDTAANQIVIDGIRETTQYLDEVIREIVRKANEIE